MDRFDKMTADSVKGCRTQICLTSPWIMRGAIQRAEKGVAFGQALLKTQMAVKRPKENRLCSCILKKKFFIHFKSLSTDP